MRVVVPVFAIAPGSRRSAAASSWSPLALIVGFIVVVVIIFVLLLFIFLLFLVGFGWWRILCRGKLPKVRQLGVLGRYLSLVGKLLDLLSEYFS
jgi:hypothetical protein